MGNGRFVKRTTRKGKVRWIECNLNFVREKITQSLRDGLSFKYSSSTTRKRQRKAQAQEILDGDIDRIVHSNIAISQKINNLKEMVEFANRHQDTEITFMQMFDAANLDILETMKKDKSMLDELNRVTNNETSNV